MLCTAWNVLGPTEQPKSVTRKAFVEQMILVSSFSKIASLISSLPASMAFLYRKDKEEKLELFSPRQRETSFHCVSENYTAL